MALRAFDAVVRCGGVRRAAAALSIDHSAVTRYLRILETWIGAELVIRTKGGVVPTEIGARYHQELAPILDALASATLALSAQQNPRGLKVWCASGFAGRWLLSRLSSFRKAYPSFDVELRPSETPPDFVGHEADVYIQYVPPGAELKPPPHARTLSLMDIESFPVAGPDLLARTGHIRTAQDLLGYALLHENSVRFWQDWLQANGVETGERLPGPRLWDGRLTLDAARAGEGVALGCHLLVADDIGAGRLVEVTASEAPLRRTLGGRYCFLAREDRWDAPPVATFRTWLSGLIDAETRSPVF